MNYRKLVASEDEKKIAGDILHSIFFNDTDVDDVNGMWLQRYLEQRTPGVEKILAADSGSENDELSYDSLPRLLVDLYGNELFEAKMGYVLRDKILEILYKTKEFRKIFEMVFHIL